MSAPDPLTHDQDLNCRIIPAGAVSSNFSVSGALVVAVRPSTRFESCPCTPRPPPLRVVMLRFGLDDLTGTILRLNEVLKKLLLIVVPAVPLSRSNWLTRLMKVALVVVVVAFSDTAPAPSMV